jgi:hypothetical protein
MTDKNVFKIVGLIFLGVGILLLGGALLAGMNSLSLLRDGVRTTGNVLEFSESYDDEGNRMYSPVYIFLDEQGQEQVVQSIISSSSPRYRQGQTVELIYRPGKPQTASTISYFDLWFLAGILGVLGLGFFIFGIVAVWIIRE